MTHVLHLRPANSTTAIVVDLPDIVDDDWLRSLAELIRSHCSADIAERLLPPVYPPPEPLTAGALELDRVGMTALLHGRELELTRQEFQLLRVFLENAGRALTRRQLMRLGWDDDDAGSRTVDVHVRRLRIKLGTEAHRLRTLRGHGYRFDAEDTELRAVG